MLFWPSGLGHAVKGPCDLGDARVGDELSDCSYASRPASTEFLDAVTACAGEMLVFEVRLNDNALR